MPRVAASHQIAKTARSRSPRLALNVLHDRNSVPILLEERAGGFVTSEEFLCHV
jgi:hypothetical protein